jgi:hypothetical protein
MAVVADEEEMETTMPVEDKFETDRLEITPNLYKIVYRFLILPCRHGIVLIAVYIVVYIIGEPF